MRPHLLSREFSEPHNLAGAQVVAVLRFVAKSIHNVLRQRSSVQEIMKIRKELWMARNQFLSAAIALKQLLPRFTSATNKIARIGEVPETHLRYGIAS